MLTCEPLASAAWWLLRTAHCGPWTTGGCWRCKPSKMDAENTRDKEGPDACEAWRTSAEARRRAHTRGAFDHCCAAWSGENAYAVRGRTTPSRSGYRCRRHCSKLRLRDSRKSKHVLPRRQQTLTEQTTLASPSSQASRSAISWWCKDEHTLPEQTMTLACRLAWAWTCRMLDNDNLRDHLKSKIHLSLHATPRGSYSRSRRQGRRGARERGILEATVESLKSENSRKRGPGARGKEKSGAGSRGLHVRAYMASERLRTSAPPTHTHTPSRRVTWSPLRLGGDVSWAVLPHDHEKLLYHRLHVRSKRLPSTVRDHRLRFARAWQSSSSRSARRGTLLQRRRVPRPSTTR